MKKILLVGALVIAAAAAGFAIKFFSTTEVRDAHRSGRYIGNQVWSGTITVTGDTEILGNLTVQPGTVVRFVVGDDRGEGDEVPADGYNDLDPTRLESYTRTHASLFVLRKITAIGTKEAPVVFTSASPTPNYADWEAIIFLGNGSMFDHAIVEYSRNGINPIGTQPSSIVQNSIVRHTLWGAISSGRSPIQVIGNTLSDCGHEGVDVQSGTQIIRNNTIEDCHAGIVVLGGAPTIEGNILRNVGDGIHIDPQATPTLAGNTVTLADPSRPRIWRYGNFAYQLFGEPIVLK